MSQKEQHNHGGTDTTTDSLTNSLTSIHLNRFNIHGWQPDPTLYDDENYMDLVMLVTRNSNCSQGYMGCVIVNPSVTNIKGKDCDSRSITTLVPRGVSDYKRKIYQNIIGASTNLPLFTDSDSDIHAEIAALGQCNQHANSTKGSTAYITMPPCKRCFAALLSAGVSKIVSQKRYPDVILQTAAKNGIEMVDIGIEYKVKQQTRIELLIKMGGGKGKSEAERKEILFERRKRRKEEKLAKKQAKRERRTQLQEMHKDVIL